LNISDKVRVYINPKQYLIGVIVELCDNETAWVRLSNGQELNYKINTLILHQETKQKT